LESAFLRFSSFYSIIYFSRGSHCDPKEIILKKHPIGKLLSARYKALIANCIYWPRIDPDLSITKMNSLKFLFIFAFGIINLISSKFSWSKDAASNLFDVFLSNSKSYK